MKKLAYVGIDYHVNVVSVAVFFESEKEFYETIRFKNDDRVISKYVKRLSKQFDLRICYEAASNGYAFQRKMQSLGLHCDVIAPSLIPKKPGDRRENDYRNARDLAKHYADGSLSVVHPPSEMGQDCQ